MPLWNVDYGHKPYYVFVSISRYRIYARFFLCKIIASAYCIYNRIKRLWKSALLPLLLSLLLFNAILIRGINLYKLLRSSTLISQRQMAICLLLCASANVYIHVCISDVHKQLCTNRSINTGNKCLWNVNHSIGLKYIARTFSSFYSSYRAYSIDI